MTLAPEAFFAAFFVAVRAFFLLMAVPALSGELIPRMFQGMLGLAIAASIAPLVPPPAYLPLHWLALVTALLGEAVIGMFMGMIVRMVYYGIELAGHIISMEIGLIQSSALNPLGPFGGGILGSLLFFLGVLVFLITGLHHEVLYAFTKTFSVVPPGGVSLGSMSIALLVEDSARIFNLAMRMAAPFIAINLLITFAFAVLGKVAPKMNVFMVSFPFRIGAGMIVLVLTSSLLVFYIYDFMTGVPAKLLSFITS